MRSLDVGSRGTWAGAPDLGDPCQAEGVAKQARRCQLHAKCAILSHRASRPNSADMHAACPIASEDQPPQPAAVVVASCPTICFRGAAADFETWQMWDATNDPWVRCYR
jgi:hypothetical protein